MLRVCVLLADGFEEIEATVVIDILRRAGIDTVTAGVDSLDVRGAHDITVRADIALPVAATVEWDAIVLPGGMPGATNLQQSDAVRELLIAHDARNRLIGAICAAPIVLSSAGLLRGRTVTSYPKFEGNLDCHGYRHDPVVRDGNIITSRGPGTAFAFALALVETLDGKPRADELRQAMLLEV